MYNNPGAEIARVLPESAAHAAGIAPGDIILSVNGHKVSDTIDFMFSRNEEELHVIAKRRDKRLSFPLCSRRGRMWG